MFFLFGKILGPKNKFAKDLSYIYNFVQNEALQEQNTYLIDQVTNLRYKINREHLKKNRRESEANDAESHAKNSVNHGKNRLGNNSTSFISGGSQLKKKDDLIDPEAFMRKIRAKQELLAQKTNVLVHPEQLL